MALSPSHPICPVVPRCPPLACRGVRPLHHGQMPELAVLPVDGSLETGIEVRVEGALFPTPPEALFFAGGLSLTVQIAAAVPGLPKGFPSAGRPLTLGRGQPCRQRPPAVRIRCLCGHHISLGKSIISPGCTSCSPGKPL
ncbi:hypothetical protein NDU88_006341 [Pleurodeles waltl]|uniref:Galectin n=1 Tax=Pleurodeles waltl TaxID=8319 RepID=A0AAV7WAB1_PLEWA|nr:hypothetical protein NDU88_006341 [Pleurodeles waltl]